MNAGIFQETPRGSEGTRPRSLDQWERQGDESSQELSRWTGEGNVSVDLREQNLLGSLPEQPGKAGVQSPSHKFLFQ